MAVDLAGEDTPAGVRAEVGLEQRARDVQRRARLHRKRQVGNRGGDLLEVNVREAAGRVGCAREEDPLHRVELTFDGSSGAQDWRVLAVETHQARDVFGHSLGAQLLEDGKIQRRAGVEPPAKPGFTRGPQVVDGASHVGDAVLVAASPWKLLGLEPAGTPHVAARPVPRVQGSDRHVESARGKSRVDDAPAEAIDLLVERQALQSALHQPFGEAAQIERRRRR